jgi:hypothetical protein
MQITFVFMYCITDSRLIQVNLERVNNLINRLKVKGKSTSDKQSLQAMKAERAAIMKELQCKAHDPQVTSRLIESLTRVIDAANGKPYTTPVWLSETKSPQLQVVKTILNILHHALTRKPRESRPGQAARARSARAEGKQAQVEEGDDEEGDDEDPTVVNDNKDPIIVIDD